MDCGYLKIILGPMFSGKTTELIRIYNRYNACNIKICTINYKEDKRYHQFRMTTHDNKSIESINCFLLEELFESKDSSSKININDYDVFLINEGQFFDDLYKYVDCLVNKHNKKVYVCGLDGDYKRKKFGHILDVIPLADDVIKIKGICQICKKKDAIFTHRVSKEKKQKIIGGKDDYCTLCRKCYNSKIRYNE